MKQRICSKCGRTVPDDGTSGKKYVCPQCDGMKRSDLREQERKAERYLTAELRRNLSA